MQSFAQQSVHHLEARKELRNNVADTRRYAAALQLRQKLPAVSDRSAARLCGEVAPMQQVNIRSGPGFDHNSAGTLFAMYVAVRYTWADLRRRYTMFQGWDSRKLTEYPYRSNPNVSSTF